MHCAEPVRPFGPAAASHPADSEESRIGAASTSADVAAGKYLKRFGVMSIALKRYPFQAAAESSQANSHVYSICYFDRGLIVPEVKLIDAGTDDEAVEYARSSRSFTMREIWERHRLVAVIPASETSLPPAI
jgi:hypothetical protein